MIKIIKDSKYIVLWIVTIFSILFIMSLYMYNDILVTGWHGKELIDITLRGRFFNFYFDAVFRDGQTAIYPMPFYIIFAIWELPIWILEKITKADIYFSLPGMLYTKGILVLALYLCTTKIYEFFLLINYSEEKANNLSLIFLSSLTVFTSTCIANQYDIITVFVIICGLHAWAKNDMKKFMIIFALGITLKYFAFLYFIPLLLTLEKNPFKVAGNAILGVVPAGLLLLIPKPEANSDLVLSFFRYFFEITKTIFGITIPLFPTMAVLSCVVAYFIKYKNDEEKNKITALSLFMILGAFMVLTTGHPFWCIITIPAFTFFLGEFNKYCNIAVLCECIMCIATTFRHFYSFQWMYDARQLFTMNIVPRLLNISSISADQKYTGIGEILRNIVPDGYDFVFLYISFGAYLLLMLLFTLDKEKNKEFKRYSIYIRAVLNICVGLLPLLCSIFMLLNH